MRVSVCESADCLFGYVIEVKQLQKSLNLAAKKVAPTPIGPEIRDLRKGV